MIREMQQQHRERELQRIRLLTSDAMDVESQRQIEAEIRQKQVDANMEAAMEFSPESFGTVCMLYINLKVNGVPVKAFIDSGKGNCRLIFITVSLYSLYFFRSSNHNHVHGVRRALRNHETR